MTAATIVEIALIGVTLGGLIATCLLDPSDLVDKKWPPPDPATRIDLPTPTPDNPDTIEI